MASTITIDALRQELWSAELMDDVIKDVEDAMDFMGEGPNNVVQISRELSKKKGDTQTFGLVTRLRGDGVTGDDELEGNEEAMASYAEQVVIDQVRHGVRLKGKLDDQKVVYDQIEEARENLKIWGTEFLIRQMFLKLGGVTNTSLVDTNGDAYSARAAYSNTPDFIPDADEAAGTGARYLRAGTTGSGDGTDDFADADVLTLDDITKAATLAKLATPKIQPLKIDGQNCYVIFVHPIQARDLRMSDDWKEAALNARERSEKNPLFRGALGFWSNVLIVENEFVPWLDVSASGNSFRGTATGTDCAKDCARALLCGRQAVLMAEVKNPKALIVEQFDYKNKDGVAIAMINGLQKAMFNGKEFGVVAVDSVAQL